MMPNTGRFFAGSDTIVQLVGVRDENGILVDGDTTIVGSIENSKNIQFTYDGSGGNFTGIVPRSTNLSAEGLHTLKVRITTPDGVSFTVWIARDSEAIEL
jgi:hypothetical protein